MMKKTLLILLIGFSLTSCYTTYKVVPETYDYTDSINFTIDKIEEGQRIAKGGSSQTGDDFSNAGRGNKFVFVFLTLNNELDEKQELDFNNFVLLNPRTNKKHKVERVMLVGPVNMSGNIDSFIKKGDKKRRKLVFIYPDEDKAKQLMVNDQVIEIEYKK